MRRIKLHSLIKSNHVGINYKAWIEYTAVFWGVVHRNLQENLKILSFLQRNELSLVKFLVDISKGKLLPKFAKDWWPPRLLAFWLSPVPHGTAMAFRPLGAWKQKTGVYMGQPK